MSVFRSATSHRELGPGPRRSILRGQTPQLTLITQRPGTWPGRNDGIRSKLLLGGFGRLRQRRRAVRQTAQIDDDVGALLLARNAGEAHSRTGDEAARAGEELAQLVIGPLAGLALHSRRIIEASFGSARPVDDAPQIRTDEVLAALFEGMARAALLGRGLALFHRGGGEQRLNRLL